MSTNLLIRSIKTKDKKWILSLLKKRWGSNLIITRGKKHYPVKLPGFVAVFDNKKVGLITYSCSNNECEIISLDSLVKGKGIGSSLIKKAINIAKEKKCKRILAITTNDNVDALRFYQKMGFVLSAIYINTIEKSRKLKPEIPKIGVDNIPIRDEIELEIKICQ